MVVIYSSNLRNKINDLHNKSANILLSMYKILVTECKYQANDFKPE
jgi:hypothetical protein